MNGLTSTFCLLNDILLISRGGMGDHLQLVRICLIKLDEENLRINLEKRHFAKNQTDCLGHRITQPGITPMATKTAAIQQLNSPTKF